MSIIKLTANCGEIADWAKVKGYWHSYTETPKPGDLVLYDWSGKHTKRDHIGIVKGVSSTGGSVTAIEGNTAVGNDSNGGEVMTRQRSVTYITGYVRPPYTSAQTAAKAIAIAQTELGTKESPANSNKVKYNTWYYGKAVSGSAYPWCMVFVAWVFAVLAGEISAGTSGARTESYGASISVTVNRLSRGNTGAIVKTAQRILYARGITDDAGKPIEVDGDFGASTRQATIKLQKQLFPQLSSEWDGIWGAKTWTAALTQLW